MKYLESTKDSGWSWVVLFGVCGTCVLSFGFLQCTGVFFVDWQEDFDASAQTVGWTSAASICGFGISGLLSSVISPYVSCRWQTFTGGFLASIALSCSPWITQMKHLYITMTLMGFGTGIAFTNCIVMIGYFFDKKLALATGLGLSGSTGGMLFLAPLIRYLNDAYSWRGAMMICGGIIGNVCVFASLFRLSQTEVISMMGIRPEVANMSQKSSQSKCANEKNVDDKNKLSNGHVNNVQQTSPNSKPRASISKNVRKHSEAFVKSYTGILSIRFVMICLVHSALTGFGYYTSLMYFVSNAVNLGIPKSDAAFLLSIFGICGTIGRLASGPIIDKRVVSPFYMGSFILGVGGSTCLLGSIAKTYIALVTFAVVLGLTAGTYNVFYAVLFREVVGVSYFKKTFGIGVILWDTSSLVALPLIGYVYDITGDYRSSFYVAGGAMLLNSFIVVMDDVWIKLDNLRLRPKGCSERTQCNGSMEVEESVREVKNGDKKEVDDTGHDVAVFNTAFYIGEEDGRDRYL